MYSQHTLTQKTKNFISLRENIIVEGKKMINEKIIVYGHNFNYDKRKKDMIMYVTRAEFSAITEKQDSVRILTLSRYGNAYYKKISEKLTVLYDPNINK